MDAPTWIQHDGDVLLSYNLPHRVHTSLIYPVKAPNGSTIILYGHEGGVTVLWRGGRPHKRAAAPSAKRSAAMSIPKYDDSVMIIDSDDEETAPSKAAHNTTSSTVDEQEESFESEEDEHDPSAPYPPVVSTLLLPIPNTSVLHLSAPRLPSSVTKRAPDLLPAIFNSALVVAAACADGSLRLFTVPLAPGVAGASAKRQGVREVLVCEPRTGSRHVPRGITLTWTAKYTTTLSQESENDYREQQRMLVNDDGGLDTRGVNPAWYLLVATNTAEAGGVLSVFQAQLPEDSSKHVNILFHLLQREYTHHPGTSVSFSSSIYPSRGHTQLLLADVSGCIRIYDPLPRARTHTSRSTRDTDHVPAAPRGQWLASLYTPFQHANPSAGTSASSGPQRVRILEAQWALTGSCILALLADGLWGLWDIEGFGPAIGSEMSTHPSAGSVARFALRGSVGAGLESHSAKLLLNDEPSSVTHLAKESSSKLVPMTPNTRKAKQQRLFSGPAPGSSSTITGSRRGGLSLAATATAAAGSAPDEAVVFWYGTSVFVIPSLVGYWQRALGSNKLSSKANSLGTNGGSFGSTTPQLTSFSTFGELITSVSLQQGFTSLVVGSTQFQHDILISAEHRLLMVSPLDARQTSTAAVGRLFQVAHDDEEGESDRLDRDMLARHELDLAGVERLLDGMNNGGRSVFGDVNNTTNILSNGARASRKVGFAVGH